MAEPPLPPTTERPDRAGTALAGRYRFERRLAVGGMAEVWEATDTVLDRPVAIKLLHPHLAGDQSFVERFRREAIAAARLTHPSIVAIYDTHNGEGEEAIVMELVRGVSLRHRLDEQGVLPTEEAVNIAARVAEALETAHRAGLVHRDIKPANILLCDDKRVMVADFGIAKLTDADHTTEGTVLGTAKYLAPEQVSGDAVDARSDLYSLGIVLYEMVCGRVPFSGDTDTATVLARLHQDPTPPRQLHPEVPRPLEAVILHALQRVPDDRPASAAEFRSALLAAADPSADDATFLEAANDGTSIAAPPRAPRPVAPPPVTAPPPAPKRAGPPPAKAPRKNWTGPVLVIGLVLVALAVAGILLGSVIGDDLFGNEDPELPEQPAGPPPDDLEGGVAVTAAAFDPDGTGTSGENDGELPLAVDGDEATLWPTETYDSNAFGNLKAGVGLVLTLEEATEIGELAVSSPTGGWSAQVYVADGPAVDLAGWGEAVTEQTGIGAGGTTFDLGGAEGGAVLLWITDLGAAQADGRFRVEIAEATVLPG